MYIESLNEGTNDDEAEMIPWVNNIRPRHDINDWLNLLPYDGIRETTMTFKY